MMSRALSLSLSLSLCAFDAFTSCIPRPLSCALCLRVCVCMSVFSLFRYKVEVFVNSEWFFYTPPPPPLPTCCFPFILISPLSNPAPSLTHSSPSTLTSNLHARGPISLQCDIPRQNQQTQLVLPCGLDSLCSFGRLCHLLCHWSNLQTP